MAEGRTIVSVGGGDGVTGELTDYLGRCLDGVRSEPPAVGAPGELEEARRILEGAAGHLATRHGHDGDPVELHKGLLSDLDTCEGLALARRRHGAEPPGGSTRAQLMGRALDALVAHSLMRGAAAPVCDVVEAMWTARGDRADVEELDRLLCSEMGEDVAGELDSLAAAVRRLGAVDPAWVPRVEVSVATEAGAGALRVAGRVDVLLGGPGTGMPAVAVEVKSGSHWPGHTAECHFYALLCGLRHGEPLAGLALWYPQEGLVPVPVPGAAPAAARRVAEAATSLAALRSGRAPHLSGGSHCGWCPDAAQCPEAVPDGAGAGWVEPW